MPTEIGHVEVIFRYPVKSMGGERLEVVTLGWHSLECDRDSLHYESQGLPSPQIEVRTSIDRTAV